MTSGRAPRIAIVGAGFAGLGMAIRLRQRGFADVTVFERADRVGGVWRENTYPGAGCDVPSPFYSFSFRPNPDWPRRYASQAPILAYLERCVATFGISPCLRLGTEVHAATWEADPGHWRLQLAGAGECFDVLICACGQLSEPRTVAFPGEERFTGRRFHSARWDHDHDLRDRRVAVIGTGASAIQFVPEIVPQVRALHLFGRSAPFVLMKPDREYSAAHRERFRRWPALLGAERLGWFLVAELAQTALSDHPGWLAPVGAVARWHLHGSVGEPRKRAALEPTDLPGCKRLLFSNRYYPALDAPHVEVLAEGVAEIGPRTITSSSGQVREIDTIIDATGFATHGFIAPMRVHGIDGIELSAEAWADGARAYLGISVPDFPNLFLLYGPNTNLGGGSIIYMLESAIRYVAEAVAEWAGAPAPRSVRRSVAEAYDAEIQARLSHSVWATGCHSWYLDASGRNANNWPGRMSEYRRRTHRFRVEDYETPGAAPASAASAAEVAR